MPNVHTDELHAIREDIHDIAINMGKLVERIDGHIANQAIHQLPPCEAHKTLEGRLYKMGVAVLAALIGVAYNALKGQ